MQVRFYSTCGRCKSATSGFVFGKSVAVLQRQLRDDFGRTGKTQPTWSVTEIPSLRNPFEPFSPCGTVYHYFQARQKFVSVTRRTTVRDSVNVVDDFYFYDIYARESGRDIQARYNGTGSSSKGETGNVTRRVGTKRWQCRPVCWLRGHQIFDAGQLDSKTAETRAAEKTLW